MRTIAVLAAGVLVLATGPAGATDLVEAWRAAERNGLELLAARQGRQAGDARRLQASALWQPSVQLTGTAGLANANTTTRGAQFSGPGFGASNDIAFNTSVNVGTSDRWAVQARKPLVSGELDARTRTLELAADLAQAEWDDARQSLMLRTAERYFDLVHAAESLRVLRRQQGAVERAYTEVRDRFALGDIPVTATHEAAARAEAIRAEVLAAGTQVELARMALADATGIEPARLQPRVPGRAVAPAPGESLDRWTADATAANPQVRASMARADMAREEAARHTLKAGTSVDLVAQVARERISGHGDFGSAGASSTGGLVGVQIAVPLYTGGYRSAKQAEALSLAERSRTEVEQARQQVAQRTRAAWLGLTAGLGRLAALDQGLVATRSRLDATRLAHQVGDRTTLDLLNAENDAAGAELAIVRARSSLLLDHLRLAALAGRLDEAVLAAVDATLAKQP